MFPLDFYNLTILAKTRPGVPIFEMKDRGDPGRTTKDILERPKKWGPIKGFKGRTLSYFCSFCLLWSKDQNRFQGPGGSENR